MATKKNVIRKKYFKEKFVSPNHPVLVKIAKQIKPDKINTSETQKIIEDMLDVAYGEQVDKNKPLLVGLSAPQIGVSKRIILIDIAADGKGKVGDLRIYINPEITWSSKAENEWYEGCYSTDRVCGIVSRPREVKVKAISQEGKLIEEKHEGYSARISQHEIDHLNGIEFVSHITDDDKLHWVEESEFPEYRNKKGWRNWPKKCPREKWERIKGIRKN